MSKKKQGCNFAMVPVYCFGLGNLHLLAVITLHGWHTRIPPCYSVPHAFGYAKIAM
jgi:hypothetical protein